MTFSAYYLITFSHDKSFFENIILYKETRQFIGFSSNISQNTLIISS